MTKFERVKIFCSWFFSPIALVWGEAIGLRGDQVRSICVMCCIAILFLSLGKLDDNGTSPWTNPHFILSVISIVTIALIAWGASWIKFKVAQFQIQGGRQPTGDPANPLSDMVDEEIV